MEFARTDFLKLCFSLRWAAVPGVLAGSPGREGSSLSGEES